MENRVLSMVEGMGLCNFGIYNFIKEDKKIKKVQV